MKDKQTIVKELKAILNKTTATEKHRGYHILPERVNAWVENESDKNRPVFYETERFDYLKKQVDFHDNTVLDIGCNIGYFLFSALDEGAKHVTGYEGKVLCNEFVEKTIGLLEEDEKFDFYAEYYDFIQPTQKYDITILLNVLHHVGDDYGEQSLTLDNAQAKILEQLNHLSYHTSTLIYQMGFNWQGNIKTCLFEHGLKAEMLEFLTKGTQEYWEVVATGIPERVNGSIVYREPNEQNIQRDDSLGEFLNRPLLIFKSKKFNSTATG